MASWVALKGKVAFADARVDWVADSIELIPTTAEPNRDTIEFADGLSELGSGNRVTLASTVVTEDTANDQVELDAADATLPSVTTGSNLAGVAVTKDRGGADSANEVLAWLDDTGDTPTNGGDIDLTFDAEGLIKF